MGLVKQVGKRSEGMGYKTMNFHGTVHVPQHILNFGVPSNVNTATNESHHKQDKKTAKRTQFRPDTIDVQTAIKTVYRLSMDLAFEELQGRPRWEYYDGFQHSNRKPPQKQTIQLTGVRAKFTKNGDSWVAEINSRMNEKSKYRYPAEIEMAIHQVCKYFSDYYPKELSIHSEVHVFDNEGNKQIYRAAPYYQGKPCYHWAEFDFNRAGQQDQIFPAQMKAFVDGRNLPQDNGIGLEAGIYALVQKALPNEDQEDVGMETDLWTAYVKAPIIDDGYSFGGLQLVNIDRINEPAILIPDLDNDNSRAFLRLLPRKYWAGIFADWVDADHERNFEEAQGEA